MQINMLCALFPAQQKVCTRANQHALCTASCTARSDTATQAHPICKNIMQEPWSMHANIMMLQDSFKTTTQSSHACTVHGPCTVHARQSSETLRPTNQSRLPKRSKHHDCTATTNQPSHACSTNQVGPCVVKIMT